MNENGIYLKLYLHETRLHGHLLAYQWILERARSLGICGASAFKAIAGYGRHGLLHEDHFLEMANELPIEVVIITSEAEANQLLDDIRAAHIPLHYVKMPVEHGTLP